jgi:hypothetical protein
MDWKHTVSRAIRRVGDMSPASEYLAESVEERLVFLLTSEREQLIQEAVLLGEGLKMALDFMEATVDPVKRDIHNAAIHAYQEKLNKLV